jgi:hypothetical protein
MLTTTEGSEALVRHLELLAQYGEVTKFILDHGSLMTEFSPQHAEFPRGPMGECYSNAGRAASGTRLRYVEGYAVPSTIPFPMMHAWLIDEEGRIIDPTWESAAAYYGVVIPTATMWEILMRTEVWGIFDNLWLDKEAFGILQDAVI